MKKVILSSIFAVALLATTGYGVNKSMKSDANLSDLALMNVEALADSETSEEFYDATGCNATQEKVTCTGRDGRTYSYAYS